MRKKRQSFFFPLPSNELGNTQNEAPNNDGKPLAWGSQQPQPLLVVLRRGFNPNPRPFPSPGEGMQPLASARSVTKVSARSLRYPRPIRESRGDFLRNRVAIVYVRSAHLNAKSHPILVLVATAYAGFARVTLTLLYGNVSTFDQRSKIRLSERNAKEKTKFFLSIPEREYLRPKVKGTVKHDKPQTLNLKP